jgi:hypothetical protein
MTELSDEQKQAAADLLDLLDVKGPYQEQELYKIYETHKRVMASKEKALARNLDDTGGKQTYLDNKEANARGAESYYLAIQETAFEIIAFRQQLQRQL